MNYLWEVALKADDYQTPRENLCYVPAKSCSPYIEASFVDLNQAVIEERRVEANPLYRFAHIFAAIFDVNETVSMKTRLVLFDICMQYIIQIDLRQGLSKGEYYLRFFLRDFLTGFYGEEIAKATAYFTHTQLRKLLVIMRSLARCSGSVALFRRAMRSVYPDSLVYLNNEEFREILIYIGKKETPAEAGKINFIISIFLDKDYVTHLFWEHHFGIIGVDATMVIDEMVLF